MVGLPEIVELGTPWLDANVPETRSCGEASDSATPYLTLTTGRMCRSSKRVLQGRGKYIHARRNTRL